MLVLIVVVAVTAFSLFVASYQAQVQAEEAAAHDRSLENIRILSVSTVLNTTNRGANYSSLTFVAGSLDVNTMIVNELTINGQVINFYTVKALASPTVLQVCAFCNPSQPPFQNTMQEFNLTSLEQVTIVVNLTTWSPVGQPHGGFLSFYDLASFGSTNFVSISLYTVLGNDFNRVFTPPTAIALSEQSTIYSGNLDTPVVVFDGSESIVPANDTIVSWSWSVNLGALACFGLGGEKALVPQSEFPSGTYSVMLTITDSNGLAGTATIPYASTVTAPTIMACPGQGPAGTTTVTVVGTGFLTTNQSITLTLDGQAATSTPACTSGTTGSFSCTVTLPKPLPSGGQTLVASDGTNTATATFTVTVPAITLNQNTGPVGATYTVAGSGFSVSSEVNVSFNSVAQTPTGGSDCSYAGSAITSDLTGDFVCTFAVPNVAAGGYPVVGTDTASGDATPTQTFTVT